MISIPFTPLQITWFGNKISLFYAWATVAYKFTGLSKVTLGSKMISP